MSRTNLTPELGKLHSLWILGDWEALADIRHIELAHREDRRAMVLLAIAGCQQCGLLAEVAGLVTRALSWGCTREEVARGMIACIHNSLGRAAAVIAEPDRSRAEYRNSIAFAPWGVDDEDLAKARSVYQAKLIIAERSRMDEEEDDRATATSPQKKFRKPPTGIKSYSQNFEDVMLWRALGTIENGFYIDVGAQDPVVDSVSRAFYEKGWRGIHVEPTPAYAERLRQDRPDETVMQVAIAEFHGQMKFFEIPGTGISTGDEAVAQAHIARGFDVQEIQVDCTTLSHVLERAGDRDIHWLKIDVEGMERMVIDSWGASPQRPWIIVVESTLPLTEIHSFQEWEKLLFDRGYESVYFDGLNKFYLLKDKSWLAEAFEQGPNIFDSFMLSGKASATFCRDLI